MKYTRRGWDRSSREVKSARKMAVNGTLTMEAMDLVSSLKGSTLIARLISERTASKPMKIS